jgi:hypothetical protein
MKNENKIGILNYAKEWKRIGIEAKACKIDKLFGVKKLYKGSIKITDDCTEELLEECNFLGIELTNSPIICLDVEGDAGSVDEFMKILDVNYINIQDLLYETTLNNGLHLYFRLDRSLKKRNQYKKIHNNLHFDVLYTGKSFTAPSRFNDKKYSELNKSIYNIKSIYDIPEFPESLNFLLNK